MRPIPILLLCLLGWALCLPWACAGNVGMSSDPSSMEGQPGGQAPSQIHPAGGADAAGPAPAPSPTEPASGATDPSGTGTDPVVVPPVDPGEPGTQGFPVVNGKFAEAGPFAPVCETGGPGNGYALCHPQELGASGRKHPILTWGNGSYVTSEVYLGLLQHLATHGFYVIATNSTSSGRGTEMLDGVTWLIQENQKAGSPLFGKLDPDAVGALGHSEGGGGSVAAGNDGRVKCTVPIEPWMAVTPVSSSGLKGPAFIIAGSADTRISAAGVKAKVYDPAWVPAVFGILQGADHFTPGGDAGPDIRFYATAWLRLHLMGDESARGLFYGMECGLCKDPKWQVERKNQ